MALKGNLLSRGLFLSLQLQAGFLDQPLSLVKISTGGGEDYEALMLNSVLPREGLYLVEAVGFRFVWFLGMA